MSQLYSTDMSETIVLLYLGRRGGGLLLLNDLIEDISPHHMVLTIASGDVEGVITSENSKTILLKIPHTIGQVLRMFCLRKNVNFIIDELSANKIAKIVVVMPHFFDLYFVKRMRKAKINVAYVIHDDENHAGDFWPRRASIQARVKKADYVFFLSDFVSTRFSKAKEVSSSYKLETKSQSKTGVRPHDLESHKDFFLIAGRMKSYKNVSLAVNAWHLLSLSQVNLVIAGEGASTQIGQSFKTHGIEVIDRWLDDSELFWLISNSKGVLLPYSEATQSGILAIAISRGVPSLITNVGALVEQSDGVDNVITCASDPKSFAEGILELQKKTKQSHIKIKQMELSKGIIQWYQG